MDALAVRVAERVGAPVVVEHDRDAAVRPPQDLPAHAGRVVELAVRLPAVDDPRLDLQLVAREDLDAHAVEEPRRVRRHVRRLVRPVVEVVVAAQADVRHEDAGLDVDAVQLVQVVAAVGLGDVAVGVVEVPLAARRAGVVARRRLRVHAELRHQPAAHVVVVEVAADAELRDLELARAEDLARARDRVVHRLVEGVGVVGVDAELAGEHLRVERRLLRARVAGQPGEVGEGKRLGLSWRRLDAAVPARRARRSESPWPRWPGRR